MCDITEKSIREKMESLSRKIERLQNALDAATRERDALATTLEVFQPAQPSERHAGCPWISCRTSCAGVLWKMR